ncbi:hypothetical protein BU23DRAFT_625640 [Bimuria novae-zelandiae CBS 107.79]|uniref:Uncharacterized protein n=1 Tax=Bimuria novae-zelandiae CBS 107.79 TaxID=1447943 RepID=A0A6A5W4E9_9PLEO|nr:hypothetical protein BU23DRAFT_625640 [Bimuria novae-zelandiae CBS 107.79]
MHTIIRPSPEKVGRNSDKTQKLHTLDGCWDQPAFHSSFKERRIAADKGNTDICVYRDRHTKLPRDGFMIGIICAFQQDLHLILRPEDVWLAIISQFSCYMNTHAEEMRSMFVAHEGKQELELSVAETSASFPEILAVERVTRKLTARMEEMLVNKEIRHCIIPDFQLRRTRISRLHQCACTGCGFPSVTLLSERKDWEDIPAGQGNSPRIPRS